MHAMKAGYNRRNLWKINTAKSLPFRNEKKKKKIRKRNTNQFDFFRLAGSLSL